MLSRFLLPQKERRPGDDTAGRKPPPDTAVAAGPWLQVTFHDAAASSWGREIAFPAPPNHPTQLVSHTGDSREPPAWY